jgi:cobalt/nickel transport system permease protein
MKTLPLRWIGLLAAGLVLWPATAQAMHLSEGILPIDWAGLWFLVAAPFVYGGLRTIQRRRAEDPRAMTLVAMVGAAVFVISCMPVPIPWVGTCSHPCGTGLGALVIGPGPTVVVASIALVFQALLLGHGGLTTLGADIVSMGVVGAFAAYGAFRALRLVRVPVFAAALAAGVISDWATYAMTSWELATALHGDGSLWAMFVAVMVAFIPTQLPLGLAEGVVTALAYRFVLDRRPELLRHRRTAGASPCVCYGAKCESLPPSPPAPLPLTGEGRLLPDSGQVSPHALQSAGTDP